MGLIARRYWYGRLVPWFLRREIRDRFGSRSGAGYRLWVLGREWEKPKSSAKPPRRLSRSMGYRRVAVTDCRQNKKLTAVPAVRYFDSRQ